jgi:eukaryotic-like serine/threonine-protein kinase
VFRLLLLTISLLNGFTHKVKVAKASPNQGIKLSLRSSSVVFLVTLSSAGLIVGLVELFVLGKMDLGLVLVRALFVALLVGLPQGGSAVIKHYSLRLILWLSGNTPLNFVKFLDHCAKLILLKKVGGGYIFIHRMLLDYFADIPTQDTSVKR